MENPQFEKFIIDEEITSASNRWPNYINRFKNMLMAYGIIDEGKKKALLLHLGGEQLFEIYNSFPSSETQAADFNKMIELFTNYFAPTKNIQYQVHIFRQIKQKTNEPIDRFHGRLRQLAVLCDFHDIDREIKTQVIQNCASQRLRRDALRKDMHLSELLATGRAFEIAERHAQEMENLDSTINKVGKVSVLTRKKTCFRCGGPYPHEKSCPVTEKKCNICDRLNHFSEVCRNKNRIL